MTGTDTLKLPFWGTILTVIGVIVLCSLGTWQVQRLHWKEGLLSEIDQAYQVDISKKLIGSDELLQAYDENRLVLRGTVIGSYMLKKTFKLGPRTHDGKQGYHLYTPLKLLDGGTILINRGWIANETVMPLPPTGTVRVQGLVRKPDAPNKFTPMNNPGDDEWFDIDFAQIASVKNIPKLAPYVLYVEGPDTGVQPIPVGAKPELYNNHKYYAVFWFMMAGLMVIIYTLKFIVGPRRTASRGQSR